jgi:hypothetical protein
MRAAPFDRSLNRNRISDAAVHVRLATDLNRAIIEGDDRTGGLE